MERINTRYLILDSRFVLGVLCFLLLISLSFDVVGQEVTVLLTNGDQITGSLVEYSDKTLKIRTEHGTLRIPAEDLVQVNFRSKAYHHLVNAKQLLELHVDNEALEEFREAIRESPRDPDVYYEFGKFWEKQGQMNDALEYFSIAINLGLKRPDMADRIWAVADNYRLKNEKEKAAETYYLLFQSFPKDKNAEYAVYRAGFLYAKELKDNEKAMDALKGAIAEFPESQFAAEGHYELGRIYVEEGLLEAAEHILLPLVSSPSSQWSDNARYILARVYHHRRRNEAAIEELSQVISKSADAALIAAAQQTLDECAWVIYHDVDGLPNSDVRALALDGNHIWIGTASGITRFDLETNSFTGEIYLGGADVWTLDADDFQLWVGTMNTGIKRYDKLNGEWLTYTKDEGLSSDVASDISIDPNGVWMGMALGGVYRYDIYDDTWTNYTKADGLSSDEVTSIASTPGGIAWCGTQNSGACYFDSLNRKWRVDPEMSGERTVTGIAVGANYVWFAWYEELKNGVSRYDVSDQSWTEVVFTELEENLPDDTTNLGINLGANDREMWFGTESEGMSYNHATSIFSDPFRYPAELTGNVPNCVLVGDDSVWFATSRGLGRLDRELIERIKQIRYGSTETQPTAPSTEDAPRPRLQ